MSARSWVFPATKADSKNSVVSFRLAPLWFRRLAENADKIGVSPGKYAEMLTYEKLTDADTARVLDELGQVRELLQKLVRNLETVCVCLLVDAGKAELEDAEAFVRENLSR